jgi:hypothetical protein
MDDPRTVFRVPDDRQVLVYVEWEGVAGQHEFEGLWKNPADKVVSVSDFKLEVRERRCSGFFTLLLSETSETGIWTLELTERRRVIISSRISTNPVLVVSRLTG